MTIRIELLSPVSVASADDVAQLYRGDLERVTVHLEPDGEGYPGGLKLQFDGKRQQLVDLVEFARATQPGATPVVLTYRGRTEEILI